MTDPICFLIPARGGSRRVPGKNLEPVAGIPLVAWAVRTARIAAEGLVGGPHPVICSTDDPAIAETAATWGAEVPFLRPPELATEDATSVDVTLHALDALAAEGRNVRAVALVQPSSPLTDPADVRRAVEALDRDGVPTTSVVASHPSAWHHTLRRDGSLEPVGERVADSSMLLAGAFYVIGAHELRSRRAFVTAGRTRGVAIHPETAVDVDTPSDLVLARALAEAAVIRRPVPIDGWSVGAGPPFVIAEAGVNHDGDVAVAHKLVDAAADAGADAVKFQTFEPARLASAETPLAAYQQAAGERDSQLEMLTRLALPPEAWGGLKAHADERRLAFLSSPFDEDSADLLDRLDVPAFKVGSGELTNLPFLSYIARKGRPMLVSTGMADMPEVDAAIGAIRRAGDPPVALLHCVSAYPADVGDANLAAMRTMRAAFRVPTGWSDHTPGIALPIAAVAMGADIIEKHLTLDRSRSGPDHAASLEPGSFRAMVAGILETFAARGSGEKIPTASERDVARVARRGLYWSEDLVAGTTVEPRHVVALRPEAAVPPARLDTVLGRRLLADVVAGGAVVLDDLDDAAKTR